MARNSLAARRYAFSLFQLAQERNDSAELDQVMQELKGFEASLSGADGSVDFFLSPIISKADKIQILQDLKSKLPHTLRFLTVLVESNRFDLLSEIIQALEEMREEVSGELTVELETARKFSDGLLDEVKNTLQERWGRKIILKTAIKPELIGGFVAKAPGRVINASVASQIENLQQQIAL